MLPLSQAKWQGMEECSGNTKGIEYIIMVCLRNAAQRSAGNQPSLALWILEQLATPRFIVV